jgi:hypothetical protein
MNSKIFPTIIILLMIGASGVCFYKGEMKNAFYWLSAAVLNIVVTFMKD